MSTARFADDWAVKQGRDYLEAARADLAKAPPGTVFFDQPVPTQVLLPIFGDERMQSRFLRPIEPQPVFITEAEYPSMFDESGHIRPARVEGFVTQPGSEPNCGYKVIGGQTSRMSFANAPYPWNWFVRIGYYSPQNTTAVFRLGEATHRFALQTGSIRSSSRSWAAATRWN